MVKLSNAKETSRKTLSSVNSESLSYFLAFPFIIDFTYKNAWSPRNWKKINSSQRQHHTRHLINQTLATKLSNCFCELLNCEYHSASSMQKVFIHQRMHKVVAKQNTQRQYQRESHQNIKCERELLILSKHAFALGLIHFTELAIPKFHFVH